MFCYKSKIFEGENIMETKIGKAVIFILASTACAVLALAQAVDATKEHAEGLQPLVQKNKRDITIIEDRDQNYMTTKIYELKHVRASDIRAFVDGAVRRANSESNVQRLDYKHAKKQLLSVSMPTFMAPHIDDMITKLDRPGIEDSDGSLIAGTGISRFSYTPLFRSTSDMLGILTSAIYNTEEAAYFRDTATNTFYWKDSLSDGNNALLWLKALDKPIPQVELSLSVYEINESDIRELGIDFITWKNGPGANLFGAGFDYLDLASLTDSSSWGGLPDIASAAAHTWSGFMVAPNFDATFLRMLAQKGKAKIATSGSVTVVNDFNNTVDGFNNYTDPDAAGLGFANARYRLRFQPNFQTITKDGNQAVTVGTQQPDFWFYLRNPVINFNDTAEADKAAVLNFGWVLHIANSLIEQANDGTAVQNDYDFRSQLTLAVGREKLLATFNKEHKVDQDNGVIGLGDIPVLKYILGSAAESAIKTRVFVTVTAKSVIPETGLSEWAGKIISAAEILDEEEEE